MTGPIFHAVRHSSNELSQPSPESQCSEQKATDAEIKSATKGRKAFAIFTAFLFFVCLIFLILINIGNVSNHHVLGDIYFFKIDLSHIIPASTANSQLINNLARSIGLHDFYQVGLWNFCEGYDDVGITACSKPKTLYWFNPVQIILDELLEGSSGTFLTSALTQSPFTNPIQVSLPAEVVKYLRIIRIASQAMFVCFFASIFTSFLTIFLAPLAIYSRLTSIPIAIFALLSALLTTVGAVISTAMWTIFHNEIVKVQDQIDIVPTIGREMFIFTWIAAGCALLGAIGQLGMLCCGTSRRDVKTGRKPVQARTVGRKARFEGSQRAQREAAVDDNPAARRRWWGSVSQ